MPRELLAGTADLETGRGEAGDIFDRRALKDKFGQGAADERRELVTGAAPAGTDGCTRQAGNGTQDEIVICHQIIRALVRVLDIDHARVPERRHALIDEALDAGDRGRRGIQVRWVVVADLDPRRLAIDESVAVDAPIEVGEDRKAVRREHRALPGRRGQGLWLRWPVRAERQLKIAPLDS